MQNPLGRNVRLRIDTSQTITPAEAVYYADQLKISTYKRELSDIVYDLTTKVNHQVLLDPLAAPDGIWGSASYTFINTEASAYAARLSVQPPNFEKSLIDGLFSAMKSIGISKFDAFYLCCMATTEADSLLNLVSSSFPLVNTAATFTAGRGFLGNGTTSTIDTGFTPSTAGGAMTQNSTHIATVNLKATSNNLQIMGAGAANPFTFYLLDGSVVSNRLSASSSDSIGSGLSNKQGHWVNNRSGSGTVQAYRNGSSLGLGSAVSTGLPSSSMKLLNVTTNFSDQEIAMAHFGGTLAAGDVSNLYSNGILPILSYKGIP